MGIGGAIDVVAGYARRAPTLLQTLGLEWLDRLAREPRRLAPLYLSTNVPFAELPGRELLGARSPRHGVDVGSRYAGLRPTTLRTPARTGENRSRRPIGLILNENRRGSSRWSIVSRGMDMQLAVSCCSRGREKAKE
jgi:hypothetical protein